MQMRRVATFTVALGLIIIGIGGSFAGRPSASPGGAAGERLAAWAARGRPLVKAVHFGGYTIDVPAAWPVYRLDRHPTTCVRYDRNAVYLGPPGPNEVCPAHLFGRVATISIQVPPAAGLPAAAGPAAGGPAASGPAASGPAAFPAVVNLPRVGGPVLADSQDHELYTAVQHPGLSISATYGGDDTPVLKIIQSLRRASPLPAAPGPPPGQRPAGQQPAATAARSAVVLGNAAAAGGAATATRLAPGAGHASTAGARIVGKGFDTCAAPSIAEMQAWDHAFSYAGIYIGGAEVGCPYGNLSAAWVRSVTALGWGLIPTYVGAQAPCNTQFTVRIHPAWAAAEGQAAAQWAVQDAAGLGIGRGSPIYYDMESYHSAKASCTVAVLSFLDAWTRQIHVSGYVSGVYSSASTGAEDLGLATSVDGHPMAEPDSLWFAFWDGHANVIGTPYLSPSWWPGYRRIKQWLGPHNRTVNGFTTNIDSDIVRGPVYR
jgi:Domain of unknown function (DUF1906)